MLLARELNLIHKKAWKDRGLEIERRMGDDVILRRAVYITAADMAEKPVSTQKSWAIALCEAEEQKTWFRKELASSAGRSKRQDALQALICKIVKVKADVSTERLEVILENKKGEGVIEDLDDEYIYFIDKGGRSKTTRISALKHRLSRAKKAVAKTS